MKMLAGSGHGYESHRLFYAVRSVPQLLNPGHQLRLSLTQNQNPELGLIPGPLEYGGGQS